MTLFTSLFLQDVSEITPVEDIKAPATAMPIRFNALLRLITLFVSIFRIYMIFQSILPISCSFLAHAVSARES